MKKQNSKEIQEKVRLKIVEKKKIYINGTPFYKYILKNYEKGIAICTKPEKLINDVLSKYVFEDESGCLCTCYVDATVVCRRLILENKIVSVLIDGKDVFYKDVS